MDSMLSRTHRISTPYSFYYTYSGYAVKAFEENAIDYILKPISRKVKKKTLERLERLDQIATVEDNETKRGNQNGKIEESSIRADF